MDTEKRREFDKVGLLSAFAVGKPGNRTFFLAMGEKDDWLRLWLEKEHLQALALGIEQLLTTLSKAGVAIPKTSKNPPSSDDTPSGLPTAELDVVQMTLMSEDDQAAMELVVQGSGAQEKIQTEIYCRMTLTQIKKLGRQAASVVAAGRPICPICGGIIEPSGHICPTTN